MQIATKFLFSIKNRKKFTEGIKEKERQKKYNGLQAVQKDH